MNDTTTPIDLDNFPLNEALRFADENSTTGGLVTQAALKTLAAKCRELTAVTEQRDRLAEALERIGEEDGSPMSMRVCSTKSLVKQALQSLNPDHTVATNDMIAPVKGENHES